MPELPDVAGFKHYLDATALHQSVARSRVLDKRICQGVTPARLSRRLSGNELNQSIRYGKFLFSQVPDAGWLVLHFGMTGELDYSSNSSEPPEYARFIIEFDNDYRLAYICRRMLGQVSFADNIDTFIDQQDLGPDALSDDLTLDRFHDQLANRRGMIKGAMLDQSFIAGPGNIWSDEILFQARLHPRTRIDHLGDKQIRTLYRVLRRVMRVGARHGGDVRKLPRSWMLPRRDDHGPCPRCGSEFQKITVTGRSTTICPNCQPQK